MKFDVVVIGAGAAGLAAARELSRDGKRVCILEARPRVGGRIHTLHFSDLPLPIELGAEFIHGDAPATFSIVDAAALSAYQLPDDHRWLSNGKWQEVDDFWEEIDRVRRQIGRLKRDMSFADFLRTRRSMPARLRQMARGFVEGYHASHADRISALSLASSDEEQEDSSGNRQFRILNGYDALIEWLRAGLDPERTQLRLGTRAKAIRWRRGEVIVESDSSEVRAPVALITIPIGVWKAPREQIGAIRFDPPLAEKQKALEKLEVGHVVKIMFRFAERFWEDDLNFVHSNDRFVPTWWTSAPVRSSILTGWAGGHAADALLAEGPDAMRDRALERLCVAFRMRRKTIDQLLVATWTHDWQSDPFSRGAYSYPGVGGTAAHKALARPIDATLFFAGEATDGEQTGTVAGAVDSGRRAAREINSKLKIGN